MKISKIIPKAYVGFVNEAPAGTPCLANNVTCEKI
jgi:hypothetical protein